MAIGVENELEEAGDDVEKLRKLVRDKDKQISEQNEAITNVTTLYENERKKNQKLQEDINKLNEELKKCREALKKCQEEAEKCKKDKEALEKELEKCKKDKEDLEKELKKCKENNEDLEKCKDRQKELEKELEKCKDRQKELEKELEKCKKDKEELEKELEKCRKEKEELEKNKDSGSKWICGEYKWMPIGSKMPEGWVKVDIKEGHTLIQGTKEGTTTGSIAPHNHLFIQNNRTYSVWGFLNSNNGAASAVWVANKIGGGFDGKIIATVDNLSKSGCFPKTAKEGDGISKDGNLSAGTFAELWQYKGPNCK